MTLRYKQYSYRTTAFQILHRGIDIDDYG